MLRHSASLTASLVLVVLTACEGGDPAPGPAPVTTVPAGKAVQDVFVDNTAANPVPTAAVGTTTVAGAVTASQGGAWHVTVDNLELPVTGAVAASQAGAWSVNVAGGAVAASQAGPWSVAVDSLPPVALAAGAAFDVASLPPVELTGTPSVNIANTPSVVVSGAVTVANGAGSPVPVRIAPPAETRWQMMKLLDIPDGASGTSVTCYAVPAGKRLVIEHVSATFYNNAAGASYVDVSTKVNLDFVNHHFPMSPPASGGGLTDSTTAHLTRLYADPATLVGCGAFRAGSSGAVSANVSLSGYLTDV